jgi:hypothetical protein
VSFEQLGHGRLKHAVGRLAAERQLFERAAERANAVPALDPMPEERSVQAGNGDGSFDQKLIESGSDLRGRNGSEIEERAHRIRRWNALTVNGPKFSEVRWSMDDHAVEFWGLRSARLNEIDGTVGEEVDAP